ncbi:MAG: hypothetical protein HY234_10920 [Acidobacteria bacterium]|nr:hypothetical protein [Acidobacteriota bacterium]
MEKKIVQYSYWLGMLCVVVALVWRAANAMGFWLSTYVQGVSVYYLSFYKGALLFLLVCIATGTYIQSGKDKP